MNLNDLVWMLYFLQLVYSHFILDLWEKAVTCSSTLIRHSSYMVTHTITIGFPAKLWNLFSQTISVSTSFIRFITTKLDIMATQTLQEPYYQRMVCWKSERTHGWVFVCLDERKNNLLVLSLKRTIVSIWERGNRITFPEFYQSGVNG